MDKTFNKYFAVFVLILALAFLAVGTLRTLKIHDIETDLFFHEIPERQIVIDATFSGIVRKNGILYSAYDRSIKQGRQSCPT